MDTDVQAGFLMYLPCYGRGGIPLTFEDRRAALVGFVYSPFRTRDLMEGILGRALPDLRLEIFDGTEMSADTLMYDSESASSAVMTEGHPVLTETMTLDIAVRKGRCIDLASTESWGARDRDSHSNSIDGNGSMQRWPSPPPPHT
jgi:hypothetical protein